MKRGVVNFFIQSIFILGLLGIISITNSAIIPDNLINNHDSDNKINNKFIKKFSGNLGYNEDADLDPVSWKKKTRNLYFKKF